MGESGAPLRTEGQSSISRSEVTESVEYGDEAGGVEETMELGDDGWTELEGEEGAWEGSLCEVVGVERVDIPGVYKSPSERAATAERMIVKGENKITSGGT